MKCKSFFEDRINICASKKQNWDSYLDPTDNPFGNYLCIVRPRTFGDGLFWTKAATWTAGACPPLLVGFK